jgi:hypothetical protein
VGTIDITVRCSKCDTILDVEVDYGMAEVTISVDLCPNCANEKHNEGYDKGYDKGQEEA